MEIGSFSHIGELNGTRYRILYSVQSGNRLHITLTEGDTTRDFMDLTPLEFRIILRGAGVTDKNIDEALKQYNS